MQAHEKTLSDWEATNAEEIIHAQTLENGCRIDVRVRPGGSAEVVQQLVCVYADDDSVVHMRLTDLDAAEWELEDALKLGIDEAQRVAGGESGRLEDANV